jgi:hypothetical protein
LTVLFIWLTINDGTATISGTPTNDNVGSHNVVLTVADGIVSLNQAFLIMVENVNDAPVLDELDADTTDEDTPLTITLSASDVDDTELIFSAESDNENVTVSVAGDVLTLTPIEHWNGTANITVTVSDGFLTDEENFALTVNPVNDAPVLTIDVQEMEEDEIMTVDLSVFAFDAEGDSLEFISAVSADESPSASNANTERSTVIISSSSIS